MAENQYGQTVESLFKGMDSFLTTKTVVGEPMTFPDGTIVLPLVEVSFGVAAGAAQQKDEKKKDKAAGGMGGKMSPSAVLVIKDGMTRMVNVKNQDLVTKLVDMVPDLVSRFTSKKENEEPCEEAKQAAENVFENEKK